MHYTYVDLPFHRYADGNPVFVNSTTPFLADFGKTSPAGDRHRQEYFNSWLDRFRSSLGTSILPVYIEWNSGERNRMDKGCIGHALSAGKITKVLRDEDGFVSHVVVGP